MKVRRGLLACLLVVLAVPAAAQSLGELAKREQDRRKTTPPAKKVYTDDDLKKITVPGGTSSQPATPADPAKAADAAAAKDADAKTADSDKDKDKDKGPAPLTESDWRARMTGAREDVRRGEMFRDALQSRINGLTADFTARDDPYQRAQIADDRQKALAELAQVNKDIEKAKKSITDIEEEARRANVPPGWIR